MAEQDRFAEAGKQLRNELARDTAAMDQSVAELDGLIEYCRKSITSFYGGHFRGVHVNQYEPHYFSICFELRFDKDRKQVTGPTAILCVSTNGEILWGHTSDWRPRGENGKGIDVAAIDKVTLRDIVGDKLIEFFTESERNHRDIAGQQYVAHGTAGRAAFGSIDFRRGPVNVAVIHS